MYGAFKTLCDAIRLIPSIDTPQHLRRQDFRQRPFRTAYSSSSGSVTGGRFQFGGDVISAGDNGAWLTDLVPPEFPARVLSSINPEPNMIWREG
jgi:hypothetical protein